jgi:heat shock protein HtpX
MRTERGFATRNRARIAVIIVLATISYWLATVAAAVAATLTIVLGIALQAGEIPDSLDTVKAIGIFLVVVIILAAVVGSVYALLRLPGQRRRIEGQVLRETETMIVPAENYPRIRNLLDGLAIAANVPAPRFAVIADLAPNSFSIGTSPDETIVVLTTGLLDALTRDEIEAVLAYEVSRISSRDIALSTWTVALTGGAINAVDTTNNDDGLFRGVLGFVPRVFSQWLQTFAMKGQIAERDRIAILFTRNPEALVRALEKLNADQREIGRVTRATAPLWIEFPSRVGGTTRSGQRLVRETALDGRIAALRELAGLAPAVD